MTETTDVVARLRAMHKPRTKRPGSCCVQCGIVWPCPTSRVLDEAAPATVPSAPADRAALRERIAEALHVHLARTADIQLVEGGEYAFAPEVTDVERMRLTDAVLAVLPEPADRAAVLSDTERQFLTFALDQAADEMSFGDGFTDEDRAALEKLRRMADGAQQPEMPSRTTEECCGAEPPDGGPWGDCWCTLTPGHNGEHRCQPCTDRYEAPGWADVPAATEQQPKEA